MNHTLRLIIDPPRSVTLNMAIDEVLMESQESCLRIYFWEAPCVTVGYFQKIEETIKHFRGGEKKGGIARRLTGGGAVFHGKDLTFSLTLKTPTPFFSTDTKESYLKINEAIRKGLQGAYPQLDYADCKTVPTGRAGENRICFDKPSCYDLLLAGRKVVGASQRRNGSVLLHQSSVFLEGDRQAMAKKVMRGFEDTWGVSFEEMPLTQTELKAARQKESERFSSSDWACPVLN